MGRSGKLSTGTLYYRMKPLYLKANKNISSYRNAVQLTCLVVFIEIMVKKVSDTRLITSKYRFCSDILGHGSS